MVRLIIPQGQTWTHTLPSDNVTTLVITGPQELVFEGVSLETGLVTSGEYLRVGSTWEKTLPYLREELAISLPVALVLSLMIALTWMRKHL